jgi:cytochrome d ubiquinol oxidase subunit II
MDPALLPTIWAGIIAFAILVYVLLDGFDLGVGVLFALAGSEEERVTMRNAIAPVWDGNETWLILIGASLYGAFPIIYAIFLPAFYIPVALLLFALIFRGVAFEFRHQDPKRRKLWDRGFVIGSGLAAFVQGAAVGTMVMQLPVVNERYAGTGWDWVAPFPILCGVGLVLGYCLLGTCWLILKTDGGLRSKAVGWLRPLLLAVVVFLLIALVVAWQSHFRVMDRWLGRPWLLVFPALAALAALLLYNWQPVRGRDGVPILYAAAIFVMAFLTLAASFWPYMLPFTVTVEQAAAAPSSLTFMFYGAALIAFPVVLIYTITVYWIFRGKVKHDSGYGS